MSRCPTGTVYGVSQVSQAPFLAETQWFAGVPPLSQVGHPWDSRDTWDSRDIWDSRDTRDRWDAWDTSGIEKR
jgi:hypothetical protein